VYGRLLGYLDISSLPDKPAVLVDIAGDAAVRACAQAPAGIPAA
jgi:hypothetical protein